MPINIIVDGYNLIGSDAGLRGDFKRKRAELIHELAQYQARKSYPVTVVFDGWRSGWVHEIEERSEGILVIYSKRGEKADSVILRLARELGNGCVVVSSDRELRNGVEACGAVAVYVSEFRPKLKNPDRAVFPEMEEGFRNSKGKGKKGNPNRLSKRARKRMGKLKKL